jgi:hypothetical protein
MLRPRDFFGVSAAEYTEINQLELFKIYLLGG